jgi:sugar lactone lactonase YvrE
MSPGLPPIFAETSVDLVSARQIADFPVNTFLESIAVGEDGTIFLTSHLDGKVWKIGTDSIPTVHAAIDGKAAGLVFTPNGDLLLSAWNARNIPGVFVISPQGKTTVLVTIEDALFLNGLTFLTDDRYLIADSYLGAIWELNITEKTAKIWLQHPYLERSSSEKEFPGVNGLKIYENNLYASNTEKMQIVKIPLRSDGGAGEPEIFKQKVNIDDFAFDRDGNLYGTTHIYNSVVKITPNGEITTIAQTEQQVTGSTALAFGRTQSDRTKIYVVTNGGMSYPPPTGIETAKVICLDIGVPGLPIL